RSGACTILNPAPAASLDDGLLALVDLCAPNQEEAAELTDVSVSGPRSAARAAAALRRRGCRAAAITLGGDGAVYADDDRAVHVPPFPVDVVDTVAAGDAFCGILAAGIAAGTGLEQALLRAAAGGAL